jgi:hypothetical protein
MNGSRTIFLLMLALGVAATASFHSSGALDERDALTAAALHGGFTGSPPAPVTSRALGLGVGLVRLVWAETGLFRAMHLAAGAMLAIAAGLGSVAALRLARSAAGGLAAALFVGTATLFGAELGRHGLAGSPVPATAALLAGAAVAWTRSSPAAFGGGLLLGLATADHPFVVFLLPGCAVLARSIAAPGFARRAALGFGLGLLALILPVWDSGGRLDAIGALGAWLSAGDGAFWSPAGPRRWTGGLLELLVSWGRSAGPTGIACLAGAILVARGRAGERQRALLPLAALPAAAIVLGRPADSPVAAALSGWALLLLSVPAADVLATRIGARAPAAGFAAGLLVLALSWTSVDRSAEREILWSRKAFDVLPEGALLLTGDPIHLALAADGERSDLDVVYAHDPATLVSRHAGRILHAPPLRTGRTIDGAFLHEVAGLNHGSRHVLVDPRIFFDVETRLALLGERFRAVPHGLAYRLVTEDEVLLEQDAVEAKALWDDVDLNQRTPPSALRDGKTVGQWFARSLLQAASLYIDLELEHSAERDFMMLLTMDEANRSLAALGFARLLHMRHSFPEVIRTLQDHARESDEGAWLAYQLLGNTCLTESRWEEAIAALSTAIRICPAEAAGPREAMERGLAIARQRLEGRAS